MVDRMTRPGQATASVLVVDDDEAMRDTAVEILGESGIMRSGRRRRPRRSRCCRASCRASR